MKGPCMADAGMLRMQGPGLRTQKNADRKVRVFRNQSLAAAGSSTSQTTRSAQVFKICDGTLVGS